jgi:hypothetical protein
MANTGTTSDFVHAEAAESAILILQSFAFFHHDNMFEEIFERAAKAPDNDPAEHSELDHSHRLLQLDEEVFRQFMIDFEVYRTHNEYRRLQLLFLYQSSSFAS